MRGPKLFLDRQRHHRFGTGAFAALKLMGPLPLWCKGPGPFETTVASNRLGWGKGGGCQRSAQVPCQLLAG